MLIDWELICKIIGSFALLWFVIFTKCRFDRHNEEIAKLEQAKEKPRTGCSR